MPGIFGGYRVKKRTFAVAGIALLAILLTAGMIAVYAATLLGPGALVRFQLTEDPQNFYLPGSGVSLSNVQSRNLVIDGSFEPLVYRHFLTAYGGDEDSLTVSAEDAGGEIYEDGFFEGAEIRVVSQTADGLVLKKQGTVKKYGLNHVGVFQTIRMPADMPSGIKINSLVRWQDQVVAAGNHGRIMFIEGNQVNAVAEAGIEADLTGICVSGSGLLAVSGRGDVVYSEDGMVWQNWQVESPSQLNAVASAVNGLSVAVGNEGKVLTGIDGNMLNVNTESKSNLNDVINLDEGWLAVGDDGTVIYSAGGLVWDSVAPDESPVKWRTAASYGNRVIIAGDNGRVAVSDNGYVFKLLPADEYLAEFNLIDIIMLSEQQFIALDSTGQFLISHNGGFSWTRSGVQTGMAAHRIVMAGKDRMVSSDGNGLIGAAQLVAEIQLESPLYEGIYQSGDLVYLEMSHDELTYSNRDNQIDEQGLMWQISSNARATRIIDPNLPGTGSGCIQLQSDSSAYISQEIEWDTLADQQEGTVYRLNFWMKQEGIQQPVAIWITGLENNVGTRFTPTEGKWRQFSHSFVIPPAWIKPGQDITIHLGFEGGGTLWADDISLIPAADEQFAYTSTFNRYVETIQPSVIRLANIPFGSKQTPSWAWSLPTGQDTYVNSGSELILRRENSLSDGLELVSKSNSSPWLVIDSGISEAEIAGVVEYLAASVSEKYGRLRMEQGYPVPWTEVFDRLYFEISDQNGYFTDDRLKAKYTDWVIQQIALSPYYVNMKNQIVFVDGMNYNQGVMLSSADYHASDLNSSAIAENITDLEELYLDYWQNKPRNPEKSLQDWPEILRSVKISESIREPDNNAAFATLAEHVSMLLYDLGGQTSVALTDLDGSELMTDFTGNKAAVLQTASAILAKSSLGEPYRVQRLVENNSVFIAAAHREDYFIAVISNLGDQPVSCHLAVETDLSHAKVLKYDAKAEFIGYDTLRNNQSQVTVLPGGVICIEKSIS